MVGDARRHGRCYLVGVLMLMKYSPDWRIFMYRLDQEYPQWGKAMMLPFPDDYTPPPPS